MWNPFSKKVEVEFIDKKTGSVFSRSSMPPDTLPDTFALDTTLHLPNGDWRVVSAVPVTKAEFSKTRRLRLWLEKVESVVMVDPRKLLFTLPTIGNELPACDGDPVDGSELTMHEDDWRQLEWVDDVPAVEAELASIRAIHADHRVDPGFSKCHVRKLVPEPLRGTHLTLTDVLDWTGRQPDAIRQILIGSEQRRVRDGFAIHLKGGWLYGLCRHDARGGAIVSVLGFHVDVVPFPSALVPKIPRGAAVFVDWCRAAKTIS